MISQLGWGQGQPSGQLGTDQYNVPIRLTSYTAAKGKDKNIPHRYLASYLPKVSQLFITYLSQQQCDSFSYTRYIVHLSSNLLFSISVLLAARVALLTPQLASYIQPRWQINQQTYPSYCVVLCTLIKPRKEDISSGYVPAFLGLLTRRISSWFFPMVFDRIPTHVIPLQQVCLILTKQS